MSLLHQVWFTSFSMDYALNAILENVLIQQYQEVVIILVFYF